MKVETANASSKLEAMGMRGLARSAGAQITPMRYYEVALPAPAIRLGEVSR
jgi:hypothetical protein